MFRLLFHASMQRRRALLIPPVDGGPTVRACPVLVYAEDRSCHYGARPAQGLLLGA